MQAYSPGYAAAYVKGFRYAQKVQIIRSGAVVLDSSTDGSNLTIVSGSIRADASASWRRRLDGLVIADPGGSLVPVTSADPLSEVSGNEIKVFTGLYVDGVPELFPQGVFGIESTTVDDSPDGFIITVTAFDRARAIARNKFVKEFIIANNTNAVTAIQNILNNRMPTIQYSSVVSTTFTIPYQVIPPQADPWEEAVKIADSIGYEIFFDVNGLCAIQPVPDPNTSSPNIVWTYAEGETSTLLKVSRVKSNEEVFNYVEVTGESTYNITPAKGTAFDNDPTSPTYAGDPTATPVIPPGPYGVVPYFYQDNKVSTQAQANAAATAKLRRVKGGTEQTNFSIVPNPAHEPEDFVSVTRARSKLATVTLYMDSFEIPIVASGAPEMAVTTRKRTP